MVMLMDSNTIVLLLADMYAGIGASDATVHDQHRFLNRVPLEESEMIVEFLKAEAEHDKDVDYEYNV